MTNGRDNIENIALYRNVGRENNVCNILEIILTNSRTADLSKYSKKAVYR